jgi:TonB family protein
MAILRQFSVAQSAPRLGYKNIPAANRKKIFSRILHFFKSAILVIISLDAALNAVVAGASDSRLTNLSVRSMAGSGSGTLIVGFYVNGSGTKPVLIRGIGPSLTQFGVPGAVTNPQLQLYSGSTQIDQNDDWGGGSVLAAAFSASGAFMLPANSLDAALLETLQPGAYTAQLVAASGPGIALVECYDMDTGRPSAYFSNISARSFAGTDANVLTVGFAIAGTEAKALLIRGIGPTLAVFGLTGVLPAARLRLFDASGTEIGNNSGWVTSVTPTTVFDSVGAFALPTGSSDAVLFLGLPAGTYTAQVSGIGNVSGTALIEAYGVDNAPVAFITMQPVTNSAAPPPSDPGAGTASAGPDADPTVLTQMPPVYPIDLRRASVTGQALIDFYVLSDGTVGNAVAIRATDIRLAEVSTAAVQTWTFVPGRKNGQLVTTHLQVPIIFSLDG